jgi:two-component system sensor histidine kinase DegS
LRIVQESLNNIRKHAEASRMEVNLTFQTDAVILSVGDDGKGFGIDEPKEQNGQGGFGLIGVEQRIRLLRGELSVDSKQGQGTVIQVQIPTA